MRLSRFLPVLIGLEALAAIPATGAITNCDLNMNDTTLSSPVTFAEFCGGFSSASPANSFLSSSGLEYPAIVGVQFDFTVGDVSQGFFPATVSLFFDGDGMKTMAKGFLSGGCGLTTQITGPGQYTTGMCAVDPVKDVAFLNQLQTGVLFVALSGANGSDMAGYTAAAMTVFTSTPEPATVASVMTGFAMLIFLRRRIRRH